MHGSRARALVALLVFGLAVVSPTAASAHTKLISSQPASGQGVDRAVTRVTLTFSTPVAGRLQAVRVVTRRGADLARRPKVDGRSVVVPLERPASGRLVVAWRTLGADGHPISGSFRFTATPPRAPAPAGETADDAGAGRDAGTAADGDGAARPDGASGAEGASAADDVDAVVGSYPRTELERTAALARGVFYLSLLLVAGGGIFVTLVARGWRPRLFRPAAGVLIGASVVMFLTNLALAGEYGITGVLNPWNMAPHVITPEGRVTVAAAVLGVLLLHAYAQLRRAAAGGARRPDGRVAVLSVLLAVTPAFGGHAVASQVPWVRVPADMLHLLAAAAWFGGIVQLQGLVTTRNARHPAVYPAARRFARLAFASVVTLVVTGVIAVVLEVGLAPGDLVGSTYGRLVLLKLVLLALVIPLARANERRHLPALQQHSTRAAANLRRYVAFEVLALVAIILVTSSLVYETPPRHERMGHDLHGR